MPKKIGDNLAYTDDIKEKLLEMVADGFSLSKIEKNPDMPARKTVQKWNRNDAKWARRYRQAEQDRASNFAEEARELNQLLLKKLVCDEDVKSTFIAGAKQVSEFSKWQQEIHSPAKYKYHLNSDVEIADTNLSAKEKVEYYTKQYLNGNMTDAQYSSITKTLTDAEKQELLQVASDLVNQVKNRTAG